MKRFREWLEEGKKPTASSDDTGGAESEFNRHFDKIKIHPSDAVDFHKAVKDVTAAVRDWGKHKAERSLVADADLEILKHRAQAVKDFEYKKPRTKKTVHE